MESRRFRLRSLAVNVYLPTLCFAFGEGLVLPVLPLFARELGASLAMVGLVVTLRGIGALTADLPAGVLVSRFGGRTAMLVSAAWAAAAALLVAFAQSDDQLAALLFVAGIGWSMWLVSRLAYVSDNVPSEYRGRALALVGGVHRAGVFAGPVAGGLIADAFGLRAAFLAQAVAAALAGAAVLAYREPTAPPVRQRGPAHARIVATLQRHRRDFLTAGFVAVSLVVVREARQLLVPLWGDHVGLGVAEIGFVMGLGSALDMTLFLPVGFVMDRWGRKWTIVPSLLLLGLGSVLLTLTSNFPTLLAVGLLFGWGNGLGSGAVMTLGSDLAPRANSGEFLGVWRFVSDLGRVAGPTFVGGVAQAGSLAAASLVAGFVAWLGAAVMLFFVAETLRRADVVVPVANEDERT